MDVLHLSYYYDTQHSIGKIVHNIKTNCKLEQDNISLPESPDNLIKKINELKPKILHLHFNSILDLSIVLKRLDYKPILIQTLHGNVESKYSKIMDKIICIHQPCYDRNDRAKSVIIENTVQVPIHEQIGEGSICSTFRFVTERVNKQIIQAYEKINGDVNLYGAFGEPDLARVQKFVSPKSNVILKPWEVNVEKLFCNYKIYTFYLNEEINHKDYCYGLSVMEAAAGGIPTVVIKRNQSFQKYVIDGYNGFIVSTEEEFVEACNRLISDTKLFLQIKRNAVDHAKTIRNCMPELYEKIYLELLNEF